MKDVLKALSRFEKVKILCHGKVKGTIVPASSPKNKKVSEHSFFGMLKDGKKTARDSLKDIRGGR